MCLHLGHLSKRASRPWYLFCTLSSYTCIWAYQWKDGKDSFWSWYAIPVPVAHFVWRASMSVWYFEYRDAVLIGLEFRTPLYTLLHSSSIYISSAIRASQIHLAIPETVEDSVTYYIRILHVSLRFITYYCTFHIHENRSILENYHDQTKNPREWPSHRQQRILPQHRNS